YSPFTGDIKVDIVYANAGVMFEELFHGFQDVFYGGTSKYVRGNSPVPGALNIEFEAKFLNDIALRTNPRTNLQNFPAITAIEYKEWIIKITDFGTKYPTDFKAISTDYFRFAKAFKLEKPGYNKFLLDEKMEPTAAFSILKANCL